MRTGKNWGKIGANTVAWQDVLPVKRMTKKERDAAKPTLPKSPDAKRTPTERDLLRIERQRLLAEARAQVRAELVRKRKEAKAQRAAARKAAAQERLRQVVSAEKAAMRDMRRRNREATLAARKREKEERAARKALIASPPPEAPGELLRVSGPPSTEALQERVAKRAAMISRRAQERIEWLAKKEAKRLARRMG